MKFELITPELAGLFTDQNLMTVASEYKYAVFFNKSVNGWKTDIIAGFSDESDGTAHETTFDIKSGINDEPVFVHIGYNFKAVTENVNCQYNNVDGFTDYGFFRAKTLVRRKENGVMEIGYGSEIDRNNLLCKLEHLKNETGATYKVELRPHLSKTEYLARVKSLLGHIQRGDIYEINFCQGFSAVNPDFNPAKSFLKLSELTDAPFGVLYKYSDAWLICGSPERYISRTNNMLTSQPIKGTRRRSEDADLDERLKEDLNNDPKERAENVMIVDLVRNDLSRIALPGSVEVSELFGIYTFKTVHQMISTVRCKVSSETTFAEILHNTFPMGSMTGAPKRRAIELAEQHETQSRGIYSGTVGVIFPDSDFDFNVVIRSITWNAKTGYLSVMAGSAITSLSDPEAEYDECMLKLEAMRRVIESV